MKKIALTIVFLLFTTSVFAGEFADDNFTKLACQGYISDKHILQLFIPIDCNSSDVIGFLTNTNLPRHYCERWNSFVQALSPDDARKFLFFFATYNGRRLKTVEQYKLVSPLYTGKLTQTLLKGIFTGECKGDMCDVKRDKRDKKDIAEVVKDGKKKKVLIERYQVTPFDFYRMAHEFLENLSDFYTSFRHTQVKPPETIWAELLVNIFEPGQSRQPKPALEYISQHISQGAIDGKKKLCRDLIERPGKPTAP